MSTRKRRQTFRFKLCIRIFGLSIFAFFVISDVIYHYVALEVRHDVDATVNAKLDNVVAFIQQNVSASHIPVARLRTIARSALTDQRRDTISTRLNNTLQRIKPYPHALLAIVDTDGTFIAHPNKDYILNKTLPTIISQTDAEASRDALDSIQTRQRGVIRYETADGTSLIFYAHEPQTGWAVTLDVPESDIAQGLKYMRNVLIIVMVLGILLLVTVSYVVITRLTRPLEQFAHVARGISHGDFNRQLPEITEKNELYDLQHALASMEESLDTYVKELEITTKNNATIEGELNTARRIQMAMIPKTFPPFPERQELDIYGSITPAKAVGGDLYDFVLDGDDFYFCIGDVSGKGVPASLFMAITRSLFRNNITHAKSPAAVAKLLNNAIVQNNDENVFVTMFIGCCNLRTGRFACCNCGHNAPATNGNFTSLNPPVIEPVGQVRFMSQVPTNLPIGVVEDYDYQEVSAQLTPGVKILLYTDGVTEAENREAQLYGDNRLLDTLSQLPPNATARQAVEELIQDIHRHVDGADQSDDMTVLCMRYRDKA